MQTPRPATTPQTVTEQELDEVLRSLEVELLAQLATEQLEREPLDRASFH
jgi:hypothetical protein